MKKSQIYNFAQIEDFKFCFKDITFIFALSDENRSLTSINYVLDNNTMHISHCILIKYGKCNICIEQRLIEMGIKYDFIQIKTDPMNFIQELNRINDEFWSNPIFVDISCIRILELFTFFKYIKKARNKEDVLVAYSIPQSYIFECEPFTSFKSYSGDLTMYEPLGFGGQSLFNGIGDLFIFMGFEGALGLKVKEICDYSKLVLVNNLPSFDLKYKDISVLNNYELMANNHQYKYAPADNPFDVYNFLDENIEHTDQSVCIAPLSTKLIALGVCLYALEHTNVRIVYPVSKVHENRRNTCDHYKTYIYQIVLVNTK